MQDSLVREAILTYVHDDEPPMTLHSADVLSAGRRARRNRRVAAAAGGALASLLAVATIATLAGAVPGAGPSGRPAPPLAPADEAQPVTPCIQQPGPRPGVAARTDRELPADLAAWARASLTCYLAAAMPKLLPEARYLTEPGAPAGPLEGFSHGGEPPFGNRVDAYALIRERQGTGDMLVIVSADGPAVADSEAAVCATSPTCVARTAPDGARILLNETPPQGPGSHHHLVVRVHRGNTLVTIEMTNSDRRSHPAEERNPRRPPLRGDQLIELASSPALTFFP